jgi:hypothetical protein
VDLDEMQRRARAGDLTPEEIALLREHLAVDAAVNEPARRAAIAIAGAYLERHSDVQMMFEIIRIADAGTTEPDAVCEAAVRALAKATEYRGRPVQLDL